ncbi:serine/threonine-protein kinase [Nocardia seriolae]|uniref:serine/threonine-protein kinase n=1 Tax=Nocardia seriolae TaxID=37332 RepID=UPI0029558FD5|nr:protein kinase [Nocardia seriolae]
MGSVYLARHPRLGKLTALKLLNRELYADREIRARFEREADLVARLDHPNIVEVYDRGTENDMLWISMQYVDGVDAASVNVATLPPERAVQVIEGVASALDYAHGMGVLHRDVKPANIILARAVAGHGERVFLTDFGIARLREDSTHLTQAGMFTATLAYASPEQMTGAPSTPQPTSTPWPAPSTGSSSAPAPSTPPPRRTHPRPPPTPPTPVSLRRPGLSPAMDAVLTKAMAKRPADRFPTCTAFAKAARQALVSPKAPHPVHQQAAYPNPPAPRRTTRPPSPIRPRAIRPLPRAIPPPRSSSRSPIPHRRIPRLSPRRNRSRQRRPIILRPNHNPARPATPYPITSRPNHNPAHPPRSIRSLPPVIRRRRTPNSPAARPALPRLRSPRQGLHRSRRRTPNASTPDRLPAPVRPFRNPHPPTTPRRNRNRRRSPRRGRQGRSSSRSEPDPRTARRPRRGLRRGCRHRPALEHPALGRWNRRTRHSVPPMWCRSPWLWRAARMIRVNSVPRSWRSPVRPPERVERTHRNRLRSGRSVRPGSRSSLPSR